MERKIVWNNELKVGIDEIDNQHKILFDLANDLDIAARNNASLSVLDTLFSVITNFAFTHFQTEEELIKNDSDYLNHCHQHYKLIKDLHDYSLAFHNNRHGNLDPGTFLNKWLTNHIQHSDLPTFTRQYVDIGELEPVDLLDDFQEKDIDKRADKRLDTYQLADDDIVGHCFNGNKSIGGIATIHNISAGGLKLSSATRHKIGDLLILNCKITEDFKLEEKVRIKNIDNKGYFGAEFVSPKQETLQFLKSVGNERM